MAALNLLYYLFNKGSIESVKDQSNVVQQVPGTPLLTPEPLAELSADTAGALDGTQHTWQGSDMAQSEPCYRQRYSCAGKNRDRSSWLPFIALQPFPSSAMDFAIQVMGFRSHLRATEHIGGHCAWPARLGVSPPSTTSLNVLQLLLLLSSRPLLFRSPTQLEVGASSSLPKHYTY